MRTHVVTGVAGFIGSHVAARLLDRGDRVIGIDALVASVPALHQARLDRLTHRDGFHLRQIDISDEHALSRGVVAALADAGGPSGGPTSIIHLAARAGVRASVDHPRSFVRTNVLGFTNVLELARELAVPHLVYASSSSVYGGLEKVPFEPHHPVGHPVSVYAATKRADELLAHSYAHLHGLPSTGLRFFTVYGPWGRPDMAYWRFAEALLAESPVPVHGDGSAVRDMTYVDDVVDAVLAVVDRPPAPDPTWSGAAPDAATSAAPFVLHNVGRGDQVSTLDLVHLLATALDREPRIEHLPHPPGDVPRTWADTTSLERVTGTSPTTSVQDGLARFATWFRDWFATHGPVAV